MITAHVNLVLRLTDGYTGRPLVKSALRAFVDGQPYRCEYREGGYFVFVNLREGQRRIDLEGIRFQRETLVHHARGDGREELSIALKPDASYPFGRAVTKLECTVLKSGAPLAGARVCVAGALSGEIKIAQDVIEAGATEGRLYTRGASGEIPLGAYLVVDGGSSETCEILAYKDGLHRFTPLAYAHKRGRALYPAASYTTDATGRFFASFRQATPVQLFVFDARKALSLELKEGDNALTLEV